MVAVLFASLVAVFYCADTAAWDLSTAAKKSMDAQVDELVKEIAPHESVSALPDRVALLCVYMGTLPEWMPHVVSTAKSLSSLVDLIVYHNDDVDVTFAEHLTNVYFRTITMQQLAARVRGAVGEDCDSELKAQTDVARTEELAKVMGMRVGLGQQSVYYIPISIKLYV